MLASGDWNGGLGIRIGVDVGDPNWSLLET